MTRHQDARFPFPDCSGLEVTFGRPLAPHAARLMDVLGVTVTVDPDAAAFCCTNPNHQRRSASRDSRRPSAPTRDSSDRGGGDLTPHRRREQSDAC